MARPTKPKDLKPKTEGEVAPVPAPVSGGSSPSWDVKYIVLVVAVIIASVLGSAGSAYFTYMQMGTMQKQINQMIANQGGEGATGGDEQAAPDKQPDEVGMNLELDEFTVNLKPDPAIGGTQYLRAKMALSVKVPEKENCYVKAAMSQKSPILAMDPKLGIIAGAAAAVDQTMIAEGGEGAPSCEGLFKNNMAKFVPTVRDVINASLMKRTATSLATLEGQESLKDEIKEQLNSIMAPNYEVLRVNFEDFIIQR